MPSRRWSDARREGQVNGKNFSDGAIIAFALLIIFMGIFGMGVAYHA